MEDDRKWVFTGAGCILAGTLMSVITGKQRWFAMGGIAGAAIVGYRYYTRSDDRVVCQNQVEDVIKGVFRDRPDFDRLGAPEIPAVETPNVGSVPEPYTRAGLEGYPVPFRVPDVEVHIDTMDPRIRPHFAGPLGPENDPVKYW